MRIRAWLSFCVIIAFAASGAPIASVAGTTGGVTGRVVDTATNAPLANVTVTANSPSQSGTTTTDATGTYRFLSLAPDSYTISFEKQGYTPVSDAGISIFADQVQTLNVAMIPSLKTIAQVRSRSATDVVKPGTTSDVYSVNPTMAGAAAGVIGPGGLSNAYGAIASVPGVSVDAGEQGWFQTVHIRGGDIDQVGYELDGIPVNRVYDNAPMTMLSSLGQQELQVYTGGTPASADAQGISGYVNQVVKTGTYPGYGDITAGVGYPAFYHQLSVEAGGATPNRLFSYYVGIGASNQDYRFIDNNDGASQSSAFFYPVNLIDPSSFLPGPTGTVYVGGQSNNNPNFLFTSGLAYGINNTQQRDSIVNLHFGIPRRNGLRDDLQMLYLTSEVYLQYFSSQNDLGFDVANDCPSGPGSCIDPNVWDDSYLYNGPVMKTPVPGEVSQYLFPSSPQDRSFNDPLPLSIRDGNDNGVAVEKLQYTHNFSSNAFLRAYGYMLYSNWFITGPNSEAQPYYANELADYEIPDHTFGGNLSFTDQLSSKHLLTLSAGYTGSNLQRYYVGFIHSNYNVANFIGPNGNCYEPTTGVQVACYDQAYGEGTGCASAAFPSNCAGGIQNLATLPAPAPGVQGQWLITNTNFNAALNPVHTRFSGYSLTDEWRPNDAITINGGVRFEQFRYIFGDTLASDPARQFWFTHYNAEFCEIPGQAPFYNGLGPCPAGSSSPDLVNTANPADYVVDRVEPRFGLTYTLNTNTVLRASFGVYARPPNSSWVQYDEVQRDLPSYIGAHFAAFGFKTPEHYIRPDTSYNSDVSWEQRLKGTDWSFKISPFYRSTKDQLQNFFIDPLGGLESGLNVGQQVSDGVEVAIQKGDFSHNGLAGQLSYTYTSSRIRYQNFPGLSTNVVDQLNGYIQTYNSFTKAGGGAPTYPTTSGVAITNPYYNQAPQPLFDRNAWYPTYDVIPGPFAASNGYAVPHVATLLLNYRHDRFAVTESTSFTSGAEYGSPTQWPGYDPTTCGSALNGTANADPATCTGQIFIPDKYTGKFDTLGAFQEPWRVSVSLGFSYDVSPRITAKLDLVNLLDYCGQRGYAWDNSNVCVYGSLPSGILAPAGNFYPNSNLATPPPQLQYPYSFWFNGNNTGFLGVRVPMQATFSVDFKL
ncbi:MAG TPA: TonB-dependent receptor [Candidatus Baltobacteraceae bacterium]|nr:TonB-dependent receptor [Candidatus Baltobacteraceae bacterium]